MSPAFREGLPEIITNDLQKNSLRSSFLFLVGQDGQDGQNGQDGHPQVWHGAGPAPLYNAGVSSLKSCFFAIIC